MAALLSLRLQTLTAHQFDTNLAQLGEILPESEAIASVGIHNGKSHATNPMSMIELMELLNQHGDAWKSCEIVLTCPRTHDGVVQLLPEQKAVRCESSNDVRIILGQRRYERIGIASPWLTSAIVEDPAALAPITQSCHDRVYFIDGKTIGLAHATLRERLHSSGFFEVAALTNVGTFESSSHATTSNGGFDLVGAEPGFSARLEPWVTYIASRFPLMPTAAGTWQSENVLQVGLAEQRFFARSGTTAYAATQYPDAVPTRVRIESDCHWIPGKSGFVGLMARRTGPGPLQSYRAIVQGRERDPNVSIWRNEASGAWSILASAQFPRPSVPIGSWHVSLRLWLTDDGERLAVGSGEQTFLEVTDRSLPPSTSAGFTVESSGHWLSGFSISTGAL